MQDLMARAGTNSLGTITNLEKMALEIPVHELSNGLVEPPQVTLACFSSSCLLNKLASPLTGLCMCPKEQKDGCK